MQRLTISICRSAGSAWRWAIFSWFFVTVAAAQSGGGTTGSLPFTYHAVLGAGGGGTGGTIGSLPHTISWQISLAPGGGTGGTIGSLPLIPNPWQPTLILAPGGGPGGTIGSLPVTIAATPHIATGIGPNDAKLVPTTYGGDGRQIWDRHRYYEDPGNTVFALGRELVDGIPGQEDEYPEAVLFNFAQFVPPEGEPATTRRLAKDSIERKGLQLLVNYTNALIAPRTSAPNRFKVGTFFMSIDNPINDQASSIEGSQIVSFVAPRGFSSQTVSATRGAFGVVGLQMPPFAKAEQTAPSRSESLAMSSAVNAVYVTAGIGYAKSDIDPLDADLVDIAWDDRLLVRDQNGYWQDESWRVPSDVRLGNSSGVVFADLNGDGWMDLYVGQCGDNYTGRPNSLLFYDPNAVVPGYGTGAFIDQSSQRLTGEFYSATVDCAAADLDGDGDLDIAVANRIKRTGPPGREAEDFFLLNDGVGNFTAQPFQPNLYSDSRSIAIGDLDQDGFPEVVIANAGDEGWGHNPALGLSQDAATHIFKKTQATPIAFQDLAIGTFFPDATAEYLWTYPWAQQVMIADVFGDSSWSTSLPSRYQPDGFPDLVFVNHRHSMKSETSGASQASWDVIVVGNTQHDDSLGANVESWLNYSAAFPTRWGRAAAIEAFAGPDSDLGFVIGAGHRFAGFMPSVQLSDGDATSSTGSQSPWIFPDMSYDQIPGNEHGYGFDFADFTGDGTMDALQTARGYNYFVQNIGQADGHINAHLDLTTPDNGTDQLSNRRGRLLPQGFEDAAFADFDGDGDLDAVVTGQSFASDTTPGFALPTDAAVPETVVLVNNSGSIDHDHATLTLTDSSTVLIDARIDPNGRDAAPTVRVGDRVEAADLDNDGKVDAIVQLFGVRGTHPATPGKDYIPLFPPSGSTLPISRYAFGFRYLKNIYDPANPNAPWFRDMAPTRMIDATTNAFSGSWNRDLGWLSLGDFDNNGWLDVYAPFARAALAGGGPSGSPVAQLEFESLSQLRDLLFLNNWQNAGSGVLVEVSAQKLGVPNPTPDLLKDWFGNPDLEKKFDSAGSYGAAAGDIDGDGDIDLVVGHVGPFGRTNFPYVLVNRLSETVGQFVDEWSTRIDQTTFTSLITTKPAFDTVVNSSGQATAVDIAPGKFMDRASIPVLFDFDGDGDLDLVYQVEYDLLRVLRNKGSDTNADGVINAADGTAVGTFEDVTGSVLEYLRPSSDSTDMTAVDLDRDGDLDLANNAFNDNISIWINAQDEDGRPRVADAWPRRAARQRDFVTFQGANLDQVDIVRFHFAGGVTKDLTNLTLVDSNTLSARIPLDSPLGSAQVLVRRTTTPPGGGSPVSTWSRQYFGYSVLKK